MWCPVIFHSQDAGAAALVYVRRGNEYRVPGVILCQHVLDLFYVRGTHKYSMWYFPHSDGSRIVGVTNIGYQVMVLYYAYVEYTRLQVGVRRQAHIHACTAAAAAVACSISQITE